ncbi:MAG: hypothetical protein WC099_01400 [Candidatus Paceibacterota bacterium]
MERTIGIEREWFILREDKIAPLIGELLPELEAECERRNIPKELFSFELFAGQVEDRTLVTSNVVQTINSLFYNKELLLCVGKTLNMKFLCTEYVSAEDLGELVVNPFNPRHKEIWEKLETAEKIAASQVAAVHIHLGVSLEEAVSVLNFCRRSVIDDLCELGDFSLGMRMQSYRTMAKVYGDPPLFENTDRLLSYIESKGGEKNVWDLVRYKPSTGTIEFRMFGAIDNDVHIIRFINACRRILKRACT